MKYPSDLDYDRDQEPTPLQEMRQNWQDDHAAQQEQIDEAVKILTDIHEEFDFRYDGLKDSGTLWMGELLDRCKAFLDQNTKGKVTP